MSHVKRCLFYLGISFSSFCLQLVHGCPWIPALIQNVHGERFPDDLRVLFYSHHWHAVVLVPCISHLWHAGSQWRRGHVWRAHLLMHCTWRYKLLLVHKNLQRRKKSFTIRRQEQRKQHWPKNSINPQSVRNSLIYCKYFTVDMVVFFKQLFYNELIQDQWFHCMYYV